MLRLSELGLRALLGFCAGINGGCVPLSKYLAARKSLGLRVLGCVP